jgi:hypothetical protein
VTGSTLTGTTSWGGLVTDMQSARDWVESQLDGWAQVYGWTADQLYTAEADVQAAAEAADAATIFGDDPATFWQTLADRAADWPGAEKLNVIWASAGATVTSSAEQSYDWEGYGQDMLDDAAYGIEQAEGAAQAAADAAKMPATWGIAAAVVALGLGAYLLA